MSARKYSEVDNLRLQIMRIEQENELFRKNLKDQIDKAINAKKKLGNFITYW